MIPVTLTHTEAASIFPSGRHLIHRNYQRMRAKKRRLLELIDNSLKQGASLRLDEREVRKEWIKLTLGRDLDGLDRKLFKLKEAENLLAGGKHSHERITAAQIDAASRAPLEVVSGLELRRVGRNYKGLCPFHHEKSPSFMVYPDGRGFFCFGCGVGGDAIKFFQSMFKLSFPDAVRQLTGMSI